MPGRKEHKPELFGVEDLQEISERLGAEFAHKAIDPLKRALEFLESVRGTFLIPAVPHITIREATLYQILDSFRETMDQRQYGEALYKAGESIGLSFGDDLLNFLSIQGLIPQDEDVLVKIWMMFDSNAGWGSFKGDFDDSKKAVDIKIGDCFLARGLVQDKDRHYRFMEGYVRGVTWEIFKQYPRMFKGSFKVERPYLEPANDVSFKESESIWEFQIKMTDEGLKEAFDRLYDALEAVRNEEYEPCVLNVRRALEYAFKTKAGIGATSQISFPALIRAFREGGVEFGHNLASDVYGRTSSAIHVKKEFKASAAQQLFDDTRIILRQLEKTEVEGEIKQRINDLLVRPKPARESTDA